MSGWRYVLGELDGAGGEILVHTEFKLKDPTVTRVLSGPHQITGTLELPTTDLIRDDGKPLVRRWKSSLYAVDPNDKIWVGTLVADYSINGPVLTIDAAGFTAAPVGQPYENDDSFIDVDPAFLWSFLWDYQQSQPGGNLMLEIDPLATPVRLGQPELNQIPDKTKAAQLILDRTKTGLEFDDPTWTWPDQPDLVTQFHTELINEWHASDDFDGQIWLQSYVDNHGAPTSFTSSTGEVSTVSTGPVALNWWTTDDIGAKMDELTKSTPMDYIEDHDWGDGERVTHRLRRGYPTLGNRLPDLRFVLGENVFQMPQETLSGDDVVTGVVVLGAGEGRDRVHGSAFNTPDYSLRRVKTIADKTITSNEDATKRAREELAKYTEDRPGAGIAELLIRNHPNAQFGTYDVGDEIPYSGDHDWGPVDVWVKIVKLTVRPEQSEDVVATVVRSDTIGQ